MDWIDTNIYKICMEDTYICRDTKRAQLVVGSQAVSDHLKYRNNYKSIKKT